MRKTFLTDLPDTRLVDEWDHERNRESPAEVTVGISTDRWWRCSQHQFSWRAPVVNRVRGKLGCPLCSGVLDPSLLPPPGCSLADTHPDLAATIIDIERPWTEPAKRAILGPRRLRPPGAVATLITSDFPGWVETTCGRHRPWHSPLADLLSGARQCWGCHQALADAQAHAAGAVIDGTPPASSQIERQVRSRLIADGCALASEGSRIVLADWFYGARSACPDFIFSAAKIAVELDGAGPSGRHRDSYQHDALKTQLLRQAGWTVIRFRQEPLEPISDDDQVLSRFTVRDLVSRIRSLDPGIG